LCAVVVVTACGGIPDNQHKQATLRVSAAASMTDVIEKLGPGFEGGKISGNYGSSSDLARQIKDGAPADVYISANKKWADYMVAEGLAEGEVLVFARNTLVCIAPMDSSGDVKDLKGLPGAGFKLVAIGDEGVPAGDYAREAFAKTGVSEALKPALVGQKDVRAVLRAVEAGEVDCGFVYATDANAANVRTLFTVDSSAHAPIEYYACALKQADQPAAAKAFLEYLKSDTARGILREAGFLIDAD
jgi:molybdate transport system substrate-binding protein